MLVPDNFNGPRESRTHLPIIGVGHVHGSFWKMLRHGWWRTSKARREREDRTRTMERLLEYGSPADLQNWHSQVINSLGRDRAKKENNEKAQ